MPCESLSDCKSPRRSLGGRSTNGNKSSSVDLGSASRPLSLCPVAQRNSPDGSFLSSRWNQSRDLGKISPHPLNKWFFVGSSIAVERIWVQSGHRGCRALWSRRVSGWFLGHSGELVRLSYRGTGGSRPLPQSPPNAFASVLVPEKFPNGGWADGRAGSGTSASVCSSLQAVDENLCF